MTGAERDAQRDARHSRPRASGSRSCLSGNPIETSSRVPGPPDMKAFVEGHGVGMSFDETEPSEIARAIAGMLEPATLVGLKERVEKVAHELRWEKEGQRHADIVQEALEDWYNKNNRLVGSDSDRDHTTRRPDGE